MFRETLANGEDISGKLQLATNLRLNKAGEYEFDLVDAADTKLYLTEIGDVKLVYVEIGHSNKFPLAQAA